MDTLARLYRILHLIDGRNQRGAEIFAMQLARSLQETGRFTNLVYSLYGSGNGPSEGRSLNQVHGLGESIKRVNVPGAWRLLQLSRVVRAFCPDVILAHGSSTLRYAALVNVFHGRAITVYRNIGIASFWATSRAKVLVNKLFLKGIDTIVSVSKHGMADFVRLYGLSESRVRFIPNGVDISAFDVSLLRRDRGEVRAELGIEDVELVLITVGNLSWEKNQGDLLPMLAGLRRAGLKVRLLVVGDGPLREELGQRAQQLDIAERVRFLGTRSDVPRLLAAADLFVLSSKTEGMPGALIEAGLAGLASVAYNVGGVEEVIQGDETGLLVRPGDRASLEDAVATLLLDAQLRQKMGESALHRCQELFDMRKVASGYDRLFLSLLEGRGRNRNGRS